MNAPMLLACLLLARNRLCCTIQGLLPKGMVPPTMAWVFLHQLIVKTTPSPKYIRRATCEIKFVNHFTPMPPIFLQETSFLGQSSMIRILSHFRFVRDKCTSLLGPD